MDPVGVVAEQRGDAQGGGDDDAGRDVQGEVHSVREGGLSLDGDGSAQVGGDRYR